MEKQAKKKGWWLLAVLALALAMLPVTGGKAWAETVKPSDSDSGVLVGEETGIQYEVIEGEGSGNEVRVTKYTGDAESLIIPSRVKNGEDIYDVTEIGGGAFFGRNSLTEITLPDKLKKIGAGAFYCCKQLKSITLPAGVTEIGESAFSECISLTEIDLSATKLKAINGDTFFGCTKLTKVTLPDTLEEIKTLQKNANYMGAFKGCESLTEINLSDTKVTSIGEDTFVGCESLKSITLPAEVTKIGDYAFDGCTGLTEITVPAGVTSIGTGAFNGCTGLESVDMSQATNLTSISGATFANCTKLTEVKLPDTLQKIETLKEEIGSNIFYTGAFEGCTGLTEITVPAGVTSIGTDAFNGCADLRVIITGDEVPVNIGENAFSGVKQVTCTNPNLIDKLAEITSKDPSEIKQVYDLIDVTISPSSITEQLYTGQEIKPNVTLTGGTAFTEGTDYTLVYSDNTQPGTGTVTITPTTTGSLYGGPIVLTFTIYREYTVSFNPGNGGSGTMASQTVRAGSVCTLPGCGFTAEGKEFNGWQIGDDNTPYQPGETITIDSDTTITATWKEKSGGDEEEDPGDKPNPGEEEDPGNKPNPGEDEDPGNKPNPGEEEDPGNKPNPGEEEDPGNKPNPGEDDTPTKPTTPTKPEGSKYYTITFDTDGGTLVNITGNKDYVIWGKTYKMPSATKSGHTFQHWAIGAKNSSNTVNANEIYTFTADTWVYAIWQEYNGGGGGSSSRPSSSGTTTPVKPEKPGTTNPGTPGTSSNTVTGASINNVFADVQNNAWYAEAIAYVYNKGIMNGTGNGQFEPNSPTTRAMLVTMLHRLEKEPGAGVANFNDVASGQWFSQAIAWAANNGIVKGYSDTQFAPNEEITREQLAVILYRYAQFKGLDVTAKGDLSGFSDSQNVSDWAKEAMEWAVGAGIISGNDNGTIAPTANATRAEVAMMLMRFLVNT